MPLETSVAQAGEFRSDVFVGYFVRTRQNEEKKTVRKFHDSTILYIYTRTVKYTAVTRESYSVTASVVPVNGDVIRILKLALRQWPLIIRQSERARRTIIIIIIARVLGRRRVFRENQRRRLVVRGVRSFWTRVTIYVRDLFRFRVS